MEEREKPRQFNWEEEQKFLEHKVLNGAVTDVHSCPVHGTSLVINGTLMLRIPPDQNYEWLRRDPQ